jgi:hypothetical protein
MQVAEGGPILGVDKASSTSDALSVQLSCTLLASLCEGHAVTFAVGDA